MNLMRTEDRIAEAERCLGLAFKNSMLLILALTHRSFAHETIANHGLNNEKLEFLGDSVLNFVITAYIFGRFNELAEGDLAKLRANLVNTEALAELSLRLGLGDCILLGKGAEQTGGRERTSILADCFEAVVGAIYLDQGFRVARRFILSTYGELIGEFAGAEQYSDFKSRLQERTAQLFGLAPRYRIVAEEGPVHDPTFHAEVLVGGKVYGKGSGKSKKKAEQEAAKHALADLEVPERPVSAAGGEE